MSCFETKPPPLTHVLYFTTTPAPYPPFECSYTPYRRIVYTYATIQPRRCRLSSHAIRRLARGRSQDASKGFARSQSFENPHPNLDCPAKRVRAFRSACGEPVRNAGSVTDGLDPSCRGGPTREIGCPSCSVMLAMTCRPVKVQR